MRRILNLNQPGFLFVKLIGLFIVVIPLVLYGLSLLLSDAIISTLFKMIKVSLVVGSFLFIMLLVFVIAEQIQDHYMDVQYQKKRDRKVPLADGKYECQYCGNRNVKSSDKICGICGRALK